MLEPAPGRASTINCWPSVLLMASPTRRAVMSAAEPGGKPIISRIGRDGKSCPCAAAVTAVNASGNANSIMRGMAVLPGLQLFHCPRPVAAERAVLALLMRATPMILIARAAKGDVAGRRCDRL